MDLVCDQTSGRIYTLNSNWILEIWNIEQNSSLPLKRLAVCSNEGNKDYVNLYYKSTYHNAKPRFLSLYDHNQQVLIVNTTCVDGSIVFIDPISFSVLKKMQLRYVDYETPKTVRENIAKLKLIFKNIVIEMEDKKKAASTSFNLDEKKESREQINARHEKRAYELFAELKPRESDQIPIKNLVSRLELLGCGLKGEELYQLCNSLDDDGNGFISFDEFANYFKDLNANVELKDQNKKEEEELYDNIWPDWVVRES